MSAYYNEHDRFAAAWLRELILDGLIPDGHVDDRDIQTVQPADLAGHDQCHFFAGIGGWPYALALAGWPADRPVWTGSCPCQPFSAAGKAEGFEDPRHLWPSWFRLIRECRPPIVFGEQVGGAAGYAWFDSVSTDLEAEGYAVGAADLSAASIGAPHIRQRLFFTAKRGVGLADPSYTELAQDCSATHSQGRPQVESGRGGLLGLVADAGRERILLRDRLDVGGTPCRDEGAARQRERIRADTGPGDTVGVALGDTKFSGLEGHAGDGRQGHQPRRERAHAVGSASEASIACGVAHAASDGRGSGGLEEHADQQGTPGLQPYGSGPGRPWDRAVWLPCRDGKARPTPVEPALFPLAHGIPNRVGTLRGAGNAIVAPLAAEFIRAILDAERG